MRFLIDAQVPPALARWIAAQGHDAKRVSDVGLLHAPDVQIWEFAALRAALIVTKDEDFSRRRLFARSGPPIIWLRCGNISTRELLAWYAPLFPSIVAAIERGEVVVEVV